MKKILLLAFGFAPALMFGQNNAVSTANNKLVTANIHRTRAVSSTNIIPTEVSPATQNTSAKNHTATTKATGAVGSVIGRTFYDLQSNSSVQRRVNTYTGNKKSATWTISMDSTDAAFPGRGSGYNHFNGSAWGPIPVTRLETNTRTGWPALIQVGNKEMVHAHKSPAPYNTFQLANTAIGGNFTSQTNPTPANTTNIWTKTAVSGNNIYLIDCNQDTGTIIPINGVRNAVAYSRSTDGGVTFVQDHVFLPGYDNTRYYRSGGDDYFIDAKDSIVAIVIGGLTNDITLWKSTDFGVTFTKSVIDSFPIAAYSRNTMTDLNGDLVPDTLDTNDGTVTCLIDNAGKVHTWWGFASYFHDGTGGFLRFVGALIYWNEYTNTKITIDGIGAAFRDCDGDGTFTLGSGFSLAATNSMDAQYRSNGMINTPQAGIDANGDLFVVYSAVMDADTSFGVGVAGTATPTGQNYRDLFVMHCPGTSVNYQDWSFPVNITKSWGIEDMYPSMSRTVDTKLHITWQEDEEAGNNLSSGDPVANNYIKYAAIDKATIIASGATADSICNPTAAPTAPASNFNWAYTPNDSCKIIFTDISLGSPTSWLWIFGDNQTSTLQNPVHTYSTKTNYNAKLTSSNSAGSSTSGTKGIAACGKSSGIIDIAAQVNVEIYPNPTTGNLVIDFTKFNSNQVSIVVENALGQQVAVVSQVKLSGLDKVLIDLSAQSNGIYFVKLSSEKGSYTKRIVLEK
jgi:PKD repeat protein